MVTSAHRHVALGPERAAHRSTWDATQRGSGSQWQPKPSQNSGVSNAHSPQPTTHSRPIRASPCRGMQGASVSGPGTGQSGTASLRLGRMGIRGGWIELGRLDSAGPGMPGMAGRPGRPEMPGSAGQRLSFSHVIESPGVEGLPSVPPGLTGRHSNGFFFAPGPARVHSDRPANLPSAQPQPWTPGKAAGCSRVPLK